MEASSFPRIVAFLAATAAAAAAGPYSAAMNDPGNAFDAPVPGFVGPHGIGKARLDTGFFDDSDEPIYQNPDNYINPLFFGWAEDAPTYQRSETVSAMFAVPFYALGPVTGDLYDIVSLGDMSSTQISNGGSPGTITLTFAKPIENLSGADFVIFENGMIADTNQGGAGAGGLFAELAYVEVSDGGETFVRIPAASLTAAQTGPYGSIDPTNVHNLAGKHVNGGGDSWGTPFDLADAGLTRATHVRLVDVPGNGAFLDASARPIYDAWKTFGSGGFDLEAVGVISAEMSFSEWPQLEPLDPSERGAGDDPDGDGLCNLLEYAFGLLPWLPDAAPAGLAIVDGLPEFVFTRDERLWDLTYEVQVSTSLNGSWTTVARSIAGAPMQALPGYALTIGETPASDIASVGVLRRVSVRDETAPAGRKFYRVNIIRESP